MRRRIRRTARRSRCRGRASASLDRLIADERTKITATATRVAAAKTEYERLDEARNRPRPNWLRPDNSLEAARLDAQRQAAFSRDDRATRPSPFSCFTLNASSSFSMVRQLLLLTALLAACRECALTCCCCSSPYGMPRGESLHLSVRMIKSRGGGKDYPSESAVIVACRTT